MTKYENNLDDIFSLLAVLPEPIAESVRSAGKIETLIEIVMDLGRPPLIRHVSGETRLSEMEVSAEDIAYVISKISDFDLDNRAGMERTLHRISAIRNRRGKIIGLTCRIGRAVFGTLEVIQDFIESGQSILILGKPGIGKTTMLREAARVLAETKRVVIVDTSNEIGGDGDVPHPAVGNARRMQVAKPSLQHEVMIEAVENHNPEVIVIDEIGRELEAQAARTIAERGVQLVGTAHGRNITNLLMNPTLSDLIGGIESVTLSDEEARRRGTQKTVLERRSMPTFNVLVEIQERNSVVVYADVAAAVDALVRGVEFSPEIRRKTENGKIIHEKAPSQKLENVGGNQKNTPASNKVRQKTNIFQISGRGREEQENNHGSLSGNGRSRADAGRGLSGISGGNHDELARVRIYPHGVARNRLLQAAERMQVPVSIVNDVTNADVMMTLRPYYRDRQRIIVEAEEKNMPIYVLRSNTINQMEYSLGDIFNVTVRNYAPSWDEAEKETLSAIQSVLDGQAAWVDLSPAELTVRRLQHELVQQAGLLSQSYGKEPKRRIRIFQNLD